MRSTLNIVPSQLLLRAELEPMVLGNLLRPAGGECEELTKQVMRDWLFDIDGGE